MNHTPTPWGWATHNANTVTAVTIAPGNLYDSIAFMNRTAESRDQCEANAAFIVRAVNSHDALVAALQQIVDAGTRYCPGWEHASEVERTKAIADGYGPSYSKPAQIARAALALAKG